MTDDSTLPAMLDTAPAVFPPSRRAYTLDVQHFMRTLGIEDIDELRQADHKAVIAWERFMREVEHAAASTIRRRLAALSSLYKHLVRHGHAARNPVGEVKRPAINRDEVRRSPFRKCRPASCSTYRARTRLPGCSTGRSCRSACRSGCAAEIAALKVGDLHQNRGYHSLRVMRKGGRRDALAIDPQTVARLAPFSRLSMAGPECRKDGDGNR